LCFHIAKLLKTKNGKEMWKKNTQAPAPSLFLLVLFICLLGGPALTIIELNVQKATQTKRVNKDIQTS